MIMLIGIARRAVVGKWAPGYIIEAHTPYTRIAIGAMTMILKIIASQAEMFRTRPDALLT
jgi:hypothetical protein